MTRMQRLAISWDVGLRKASWALVAGAVTLLAGCGPTKFEATTDIPQPLITQIPVVVGLHMPHEFREKVHREERYGSNYEIAIGKAQTAGFERLMKAMFEEVILVAGTDAASQVDPRMRGVIEPVLEDFSFITPRDAGSPFYAVSVRYRLNGYNREGQLFESWSFTGYGSVPAPSIPKPGTDVLREATRIAMRDAGAKMAAEFREQAVVRGLLPPEAGQAPAPGAAPPSQPPGVPATPPGSNPADPAESPTEVPAEATLLPTPP
jgi:hypothetical protein